MKAPSEYELEGLTHLAEVGEDMAEKWRSTCKKNPFRRPCGKKKCVECYDAQQLEVACKYVRELIEETDLMSVLKDIKRSRR